jgi:exonuclease VII large subunit
MAVPVLMDLWAFLQDRQQRLTTVMTQSLAMRQTALLAASRGLPDLTGLIEAKMQRLDDWGERLPSLARRYIQNLDGHLTALSQSVRHPQEVIHFSEQRYGSLSQQFRHSARRLFEVAHQRFELLASRLDHASYQRILYRGFCWTTAADGTLIMRASQIRKGAALTLHYGDGVVSVVESSSPMGRGKREGTDSRQGKLF